MRYGDRLFLNPLGYTHPTKLLMHHFSPLRLFQYSTYFNIHYYAVKFIPLMLIIAKCDRPGLTLNQEIIHRLLRREIMKESVTSQEILLEDEAKGKAIGKAEAANQIVLNMLRSDISIDLISQFTGLSLEQIKELQKQH